MPGNDLRNSTINLSQSNDNIYLMLSIGKNNCRNIKIIPGTNKKLPSNHESVELMKKIISNKINSTSNIIKFNNDDNHKNTTQQTSSTDNVKPSSSASSLPTPPPTPPQISLQLLSADDSVSVSSISDITPKTSTQQQQQKQEKQPKHLQKEHKKLYEICTSCSSNDVTEINIKLKSCKNCNNITIDDSGDTIHNQKLFKLNEDEIKSALVLYNKEELGGRECIGDSEEYNSNENQQTLLPLSSSSTSSYCHQLAKKLKNVYKSRLNGHQENQELESPKTIKTLDNQKINSNVHQFSTSKSNKSKIKLREKNSQNDVLILKICDLDGMKHSQKNLSKTKNDITKSAGGKSSKHHHHQQKQQHCTTPSLSNQKLIIDNDDEKDIKSIYHSTSPIIHQNDKEIIIIQSNEKYLNRKTNSNISKKKVCNNISLSKSLDVIHPFPVPPPPFELTDNANDYPYYHNQQDFSYKINNHTSKSFTNLNNHGGDEIDDDQGPFESINSVELIFISDEFLNKAIKHDLKILKNKKTDTIKQQQQQSNNIKASNQASSVTTAETGKFQQEKLQNLKIINSSKASSSSSKSARANHSPTCKELSTSPTVSQSQQTDLSTLQQQQQQKSISQAKLNSKKLIVISEDFKRKSLENNIVIVDTTNSLINSSSASPTSSISPTSAIATSGPFKASPSSLSISPTTPTSAINNNNNNSINNNSNKITNGIDENKKIPSQPKPTTISGPDIIIVSSTTNNLSDNNEHDKVSITSSDTASTKGKSLKHIKPSVCKQSSIDDVQNQMTSHAFCSIEEPDQCLESKEIINNNNVN